jgi:hypothetical protein
MNRQDFLQCVPTMYACFAGGGKPMYKTKQDWWAPPDYLEIGYSEAAMEGLNQIVYEQVPERVVKHAARVEAMYKDKKK